MTHLFYARTSLLFLLLGLIACKTETATKSRIKLDNGEYITNGSANNADGIFFSETRGPGNSFGSSCTGTAVSTTTVITAGHCVFNVGSGGWSQTPDVYDKTTGAISGKEFCISNKIYKKVCSNKLFVNPSYPSAAPATSDSGFVVFPEGTFKSYHSINTTDLKVGDKVLMVGYSDQDLPGNQQQSTGVKRFGFNTVLSFEPGAQNGIVTNDGNSVQSVGISPGDLGGPMMKDCKVNGIASRLGVSDAPDGGVKKVGVHTNLTANTQIDFLRRSTGNGAYFCGLSGNDPKYCPAEFLNNVNPKAGEKEFPCAIGAPTTPTPGQNVPPSSGSTLFAMLSEANELQVRGTSTLSVVEICLGATLDAAKSCTDKRPALPAGQDFKSAALNIDSSALWFIQIHGTETNGGKTVVQVIKLNKK